MGQPAPMIRLCDKCLEANRLLQGKKVYIPKRDRFDPANVIALALDGVGRETIAASFGVSPRRISQILKNSGYQYRLIDGKYTAVRK